MNDPFEAFEERRITGDGVEIYARIGGAGPPLALLHGFPQSHMMWGKIAPALAQTFTVVAMDLRGYGRSQRPENTPDNAPYSKRAMARDVVAVMARLGFERFNLAGHDRGGRVAYRLALDHPDRVSRLAILDIITTYDMWAGMNHAMAMKTYHWPFLAQPAPLPERLIAAQWEFYLETKLSTWNGAGDLAAFAPEALADYKRFFRDPEVIHAMCNDYRAGETYDVEADRRSLEAGEKIACPTLVLWGERGIPAEDNDNPLALWRRWCVDVAGHGVDSGHFIAEEAPAATLAALEGFFAGGGEDGGND